MEQDQIQLTCLNFETSKQPSLRPEMAELAARERGVKFLSSPPTVHGHLKRTRTGEERRGEEETKGDSRMRCEEKRIGYE